MKNFRAALAIIAFVLCLPAFGQTDLSGTWEGTLSIDANTQLEIQFIFTADGDSYKAVLNAPDQPNLSNIPVDSLTLENGMLSMSVGDVNGDYQGTVGAGSIEGKWTQQGAEFALNLTPYVEPVLTAAAEERLLGSWVGELRPIPNGEMVIHVVFRFERDDAGNFVALFDSPDEGAIGMALDSVALEGDELTVKLNMARMEFVGVIGEAGIDGQWNQAGRSLDLMLERGVVEVPGLALSPESFARIQGPWHASIGPMTVVFRFEKNADGKMLGFMDSPDQGASGIPLSSVSVDGDQLMAAVAAAGISFTGSIGSAEISGTWSQGPQSLQVSFVQGAYVPNSGVPDAVRQALAGTWRGNVNGTDLVFRFESSADSFLAFLDVPSMNAVGLPVGNIEAEGENLSLSVGAIGATFAGTLNAQGLSGQWTRAGNPQPLSLNKD